MKRLKFAHEDIDKLFDGRKTDTWRLKDDKNLSLDDEIECIDRKTDKAVGRGVVTQLVVKRLKDITEGELSAHGFASYEAMYERFRGFYGPDVGPDSQVKQVSFTFTPYPKPQKPQPSDNSPLPVIKMYADGGSRGNPGPSASGYVLLDMDDNILFKTGVYLGITTNNQAEYLALKYGLEEAQKRGAQEVDVYMDSLLVVNQMKGIFKVRNRDLWPIHEAIKEQIKQFKKVIFTHVPRELNKLADAEVNTTLDAELQR